MNSGGMRSEVVDKVACFDFFFFFQAEDGIRDLTVTGVQTCALPISGAAPASKAHALQAAQLEVMSCSAHQVVADCTERLATAADDPELQVMLELEMADRKSVV